MTSPHFFVIYIYITLQVSKIFLSQQYIYILYIHDYTYIIIYIFFTENILHDITCIHISFTYILHIKHTWLYIHNHTYICILYYIHFFLQRSPQVPSESLRFRLRPPSAPARCCRRSSPRRRPSSAARTRWTGPRRSQSPRTWQAPGHPAMDPAGPWEKMGKIYGKITGKLWKYRRNTGKCWSSKSWKAKRCSHFFQHFGSQHVFPTLRMDLEALHRFPSGVLVIRWTFVQRTASFSSCFSGGAFCRHSQWHSSWTVNNDKQADRKDLDLYIFSIFHNSMSSVICKQFPVWEAFYCIFSIYIYLLLQSFAQNVPELVHAEEFSPETARPCARCSENLCIGTWNLQCCRFQNQ